jgi:hypothetical protein
MSSRQQGKRLSTVAAASSQKGPKASLHDDHSSAYPRYKVLVDGAVLSDTASLGGARRGELRAGQEVDVLETRKVGDRIRAKVDFGGFQGWMSLCTSDGNFTWAREIIGDRFADYPSYWQNCDRADFRECVTADNQLLMLQNVFDDWANRLGVDKTCRMSISRLERNESSSGWRRYSKGKSAQSTRQAVRTIGAPLGEVSGRRGVEEADPGILPLSIRDYSDVMPMAALDAGANETYLFHRCGLQQLHQIRKDGFLDNFMGFMESPYNLQDVRGRWDDAPSAGRGGTTCAASRTERCMVVFRVAVGTEPVDMDSGVSIQGTLGMPRMFSTMMPELVYPEYFVFYFQGTDGCGARSE